MSADIALLVAEPGDSCGIAYLNSISGGSTVGVVGRTCATGYYTTGHEIGHMYGCFHNKEMSGPNPIYPKQESTTTPARAQLSDSIPLQQAMLPMTIKH